MSIFTHRLNALAIKPLRNPYNNTYIDSIMTRYSKSANEERCVSIATSHCSDLINVFSFVLRIFGCVWSSIHPSMCDGQCSCTVILITVHTSVQKFQSNHMPISPSLTPSGIFRHIKFTSTLCASFTYRQTNRNKKKNTRNTYNEFAGKQNAKDSKIGEANE